MKDLSKLANKKIYPEDLEKIVDITEGMESFFRSTAEAINSMNPDEKVEALKGIEFLNRMGASLWNLHEDYTSMVEDISSNFASDWDAFALGCAVNLYPSLRQVPLDSNDNVASAYYLGDELGSCAQASEKVRNLIEQKASQAKGVFVGGTKIPALLGDDSLHDALAGYVSSDSDYNTMFGLVVNENGVTPIKFAFATYGIGLEHAIDISAWENMGKPPYVESVVQDIPYILSSIRQYPQTTLEEWRNGSCSTLRFAKLTGPQGEQVFAVKPFDANILFDVPAFLFDADSKKLVPYELDESVKPSWRPKFTSEAQKQRLTELVNEAVNSCEPLKCYFENGGVIPAEEVKPEWITNTYEPSNAVSKRAETSGPSM